MPKKKSGPAPDGSVLLVLYNPFGLPSTEVRVGSIMQYGNTPNKEVIYRVKQILRWLAHLGLRVSQVFGKRTEFAVIVDVQESDEACIEAAIGMHRWTDYLIRCPKNWLNETSHIYRGVSTSIEHLERTLGFVEYAGIDPTSLGPRQLSTEGTFVHPFPPPSLPENDKFPPRQSGLTLYIRPKALSGSRLAPSGGVDDFLNSITLAQSSSEGAIVEPVPESMARVKNESDDEDKPNLLNAKTIVVKSEELEVPANLTATDTTNDLPLDGTKDETSRTKTADPLEGFDEETRSKMSAILQGIGVTNLAELPSDFLTKLKESVTLASRIKIEDSEAGNTAERSNETSDPATVKRRNGAAPEEPALKRVKTEDSDW